MNTTKQNYCSDLCNYPYCNCVKYCDDREHEPFYVYEAPKVWFVTTPTGAVVSKHDSYMAARFAARDKLRDEVGVLLRESYHITAAVSTIVKDDKGGDIVIDHVRTRDPIQEY